MKQGALIAIANKHGETPLSKARPRLRKKLECKDWNMSKFGMGRGLILTMLCLCFLLTAMAEEFGQSLLIVPHKSKLI